MALLVAVEEALLAHRVEQPVALLFQDVPEVERGDHPFAAFMASITPSISDLSIVTEDWCFR